MTKLITFQSLQLTGLVVAVTVLALVGCGAPLAERGERSTTTPERPIFPEYRAENLNGKRVTLGMKYRSMPITVQNAVVVV